MRLMMLATTARWRITSRASVTVTTYIYPHEALSFYRPIRIAAQSEDAVPPTRAQEADPAAAVPERQRRSAV